MSNFSKRSTQNLADGQPPRAKNPTFFTFYIGALAVWALFAAVLSSATLYGNLAAIKLNFVQACESHFEVLQDNIRSSETVLEGFAALFGSGSNTNSGQAKIYAQQILSRYPHIFALEIARVVPKEELESFITAQRNGPFPDFQLRTFSYGSKRTFAQVKDKALYYPIVFMEPMRPESAAIIGLDIETVPFLRDAMFESIRRKSSVSSPPFHLVEGNLAYVMFHPVTQSPEIADRAPSTSGAPFNVELVVDASKIIKYQSDSKDKKLSINLHDSRHRADDLSGRIFFTEAERLTRLEEFSFPLLTYQKTLPFQSSPFILDIHRQIGWRDLNKGLLLLIAIILASSFCMVLVYSRSHFRREQGKFAQGELLWYRANHDHLTGLANRAFFTTMANTAIARSARHQKKFAIVLLDLNDFKTINDQFGHDAGDKLLQAVATRLGESIRSNDIGARFGGDEFLVLLEDFDDLDSVIKAVKKISSEVSAEYIVKGKRLNINASSGYAVFPDDAVTVETLFDCADQRMYELKRVSGKPAEQGLHVFE